MAKTEFIDERQFKVVTKEGHTYIMWFYNPTNYLMDKQMGGLFSDIMAEIFDKYYTGDADSIHNSIARQMIINHLDFGFCLLNDRDQERERIGSRIRELREFHNIGSKELAQRIGIDAANMSRIEHGRLSVGLDILNKIAGALSTKIDFVPLNQPNDDKR